MPKISVSLKENLKADIKIRSHTLRVDEPTDKGGDDTGPTPYEMMLASLGACAAITMQLYSRRKDWPLEEVEVEVDYERVHADDCAECERVEGKAYVDLIRMRYVLHGDLTPEQRARIAEIGGRCPVHKTVEAGANFLEEVAVD